MLKKIKWYTIDDYEDIGDNRCGIYLITNTVTGKRYVGQSCDIKYRWYQHISNPEKNQLYKDFKQYGLINFIFQIIEECNPRYLDEKEYFWIQQFNSYEDGYNSTIGNYNKIKNLTSLEVPNEYEAFLIKRACDLGDQKRLPGEDFDYIHGTDDPDEIDFIIKEIEENYF